MVQDRDFKSMMDEREAGKARGPPSGSHFAKMQNSTVWGVKPNFMGEDKDWPMPKEIPKAKVKENDGHVEKATNNDSIKEPTETKSADETKGLPKTKKPKAVNTRSTGAFDDMMGHPMEQLDNIMNTTFPGRKEHKEASAKLADGTRPFRDMMIEKGKKSRENQKKLGESESLPDEKITFSNGEGDSNLNQMIEGYVNDPNIKEALNRMANAPTEIPDTRGEIISTDDGEDFDEDVYQYNIDYHGKKGDLNSGKWGVKLANLPYFMDRYLSMEDAFKTLTDKGFSREEAANMIGYATRAAWHGDRKSLPNHYYESPITSHKQASAELDDGTMSFKDMMEFRKAKNSALKDSWKKPTKEQKEKKEKKDAEKKKDEEEEDQRKDSEENASEMAGDYDIQQYNPENESVEENVVADSNIPDIGTEFVTDEVDRFGNPVTTEVTATDYGDMVDKMIKQKLATNPYYGAVSIDSNKPSLSDLAKDPKSGLKGVSPEDQSYIDRLANRNRDNKTFGGRGETAKHISRMTGQPVQTNLDLAGPIGANMDAKAPENVPTSMNIPKNTEQTRMIDSNLVSSKGVTPLESEKGTKNGGKPPLMQTDLTNGENSVFGNSPKQSLDREADIHALGGGIPSFRELMGDRMGQTAASYNNGKEQIPRGKRGQEVVGDRTIGIGPVTDLKHSDGNIQVARKDHYLPLVAAAEYNLPKGQYSPSGRIYL